MNPLELLAQLLDLTGAPLAVGTYMTRGDEETTLKVILLVELLGTARGPNPGNYAVAIARDDGRVCETADRMPAGSTRKAIAVQLEPGRYRLHTAVVDGEGRPGSLETPLLVGLRQAGPLQFSDLILGATVSSFTPAVRIPAGTAVDAILELYSADPADLNGLDASLEIRREGDDEVTARVPAGIRTTALDRRRMANAAIPAAHLGTGQWLVSCVVRRGDSIVGRVSRQITVE